MKQATERRSFKVRFFETEEDGHVHFDFAHFQQVFFMQVIALLLLFSPWVARQVHPPIAPGTALPLVVVKTIAPWLFLAGWTAIFYVVAAFFEWVFHRYLFHIVPNFMARKHTLHHYMHPVENYQTHEEHQTESAHFPLHALVTFLGIFTLASWPIQHVMPHQPILLAVNLAVALGYYRYELTHAQKHYSFSWQVEQLNNPATGRRYEERFVLHFIHHDKSLPDRLLGTFLPGSLLRDDKGNVVVQHEDTTPYFTIVLPETLPRPVGIVRALDRLSLRWQATFFRLFPTKRGQYHF